MSKTYSCILVGLNVVVVEIETVVGAGFSGLNILGLKSDLTRDMRERIRAALESVGLSIPAKRVTVNISCQELIKFSRTPFNELDFAVAASVIKALFEDQGIKLRTQNNEFFGGELSLSGAIRKVSQQLIYESLVHEKSDINVYIHQEDDFFKNNIFNCKNLSSWVNNLRNPKKSEVKIETCNSDNLEKNSTESSMGLETKFEQKTEQLIFEHLKKLSKNPKACVAVCAAVVGRHHLLLGGEPGIGKSTAINLMKDFYLPLNQSEEIELQLIYSSKNKMIHRPFRSPHHSSSSAAIIGGQTLKPGEVTLAHHGILFLDEIAEFSRPTLEALREPLDSGKVDLSRAAGQISYPSKFQLCATTNPCQCGFFFSKLKPCRCNPTQSKKYLSKISGPLIDRFCLHVWLEKDPDENDCFSSFIISASDDDLKQFAGHIVHLQKNPYLNSCTQKNSLYETILEYCEHESLRSQNKLLAIQNTFYKLFSPFINDNNFTKDILKYRSFSRLISEM